MYLINLTNLKSIPSIISLINKKFCNNEGAKHNKWHLIGSYDCRPIDETQINYKSTAKERQTNSSGVKEEF